MKALEALIERATLERDNAANQLKTDKDVLLYNYYREMRSYHQGWIDALQMAMTARKSSPLKCAGTES